MKGERERGVVRRSKGWHIYDSESALTNIKAHEVVSETVKNSLQRATLFATIFSATLAQVKPHTKFDLFGDNTFRANIVEMVSGETISLPPKRPNLVRGFT